MGSSLRWRLPVPHMRLEDGGRFTTRARGWEAVWLEKGRGSCDNIRDLNGHENTDMDGELVAKAIMKEVGYVEGDTFLEVGCGAGYLLQFFPTPLVGCERSSTLVDKGRSLLPGSSLEACEANCLPYETGTFDHVVLFSVSQYFPSFEYFEQVAREMLRVSKKSILLGDLRRVAKPSGTQTLQVEGELRYFTIRPFDVLALFPGSHLSEAYYENAGKSFNAIVWKNASISLSQGVASDVVLGDVSALCDQFREKGFIYLPGLLTREAMAYFDSKTQGWKEDLEALLPYKYLDPASIAEKCGGADIPTVLDGGSEQKLLMTRVERFIDLDVNFSMSFFPPFVLEILRQIFKGRSVLFKDKLNYKLGNGGRPDVLHQDAAAGWQKYAHDFVSMVIFLDENTFANAAVSILKTGNYPRELMGNAFEPLPNCNPPFEPAEDYELLEGPAGSVAFFDAYVPHGSPANHSPNERRNIYITFNAAADGDFYDTYYEDKLQNYPPNSMRKSNKEYKFLV